MLKNGDQPGSAIRTGGESMEGLERLDHRFLDEILRLRPIACEPHGVTKQPVGVRHRFRFEREPAAIGFGISAHKACSANGPQRHNRGRASLYSILFCARMRRGIPAGRRGGEPGRGSRE